jgi:hypothetical protein
MVYGLLDGDKKGYCRYCWIEQGRDSHECTKPERDDKWSHLYSDYLEDIDQHRFTYPGCL